MPLPDNPVVFMKPTTTVTGDGTGYGHFDAILQFLAGHANRPELHGVTALVHVPIAC